MNWTKTLLYVGLGYLGYKALTKPAGAAEDVGPTALLEAAKTYLDPATSWTVTTYYANAKVRIHGGNEDRTFNSAAEAIKWITIDGQAQPGSTKAVVTWMQA